MVHVEDHLYYLSKLAAWLVLKVLTDTRTNDIRGPTRASIIFSLVLNLSINHKTKLKDISVHYWRSGYWYQHVSAGQAGAGTNVPEQYPAGTLVPARNLSRY